MSTIMTVNTAQEIENAEIHMLSSRLEALQTISGNPMQVQMKKFGSATAFSSKIIAGPAFNTVKGVTFTKNGVRQNNEILYNKPGWHFFIAEVQNTPASIGVLYINKGVASLAASATLPEFQRKGCHTLLIQKRIETAVASNCNLIVGQARFGSGSQNNMERAHMKIAYTKSIWTAKDI
ncbi:GNAT family N-acetyltransferase [Bacillus mycoides]|uniref:GNAT family N-acetyltransferase n=1 Tax=Bacillus TaxID=1386 RepID=UPI001C5A8C73|nr:GNAT family N-acetyltransferase [Bacillus sp. FDAARGOS_1420]MBW3495022.1 hypothetical protein [Bacillus sp. FDAARGOS_1420]